MNYSYGSRCAIALSVAALFCVLSSGSAVAQAGGGGGGGGGDSIQFANFYATPLTGNVEGTIEFLDPNGTVPTNFPYWQESQVINGTANTVTFFQTVYMYDNKGTLVDSMSHVLDVPALKATDDWTMAKTVTMSTGLYSLEGDLGYFDSQNTAQSLDEESEDFTVANF